MNPLLAFFTLGPALLPAQTGTPRVTLDAHGDDVREVLASLFTQAKRSYAIDPEIAGKLYMRLDHLPYAQALSIVLSQAKLVAKDRDGVTMVALAPHPSAPKAETPKAPAPVVARAKPKTPALPTGLDCPVTTHVRKTPLAEVLAKLGLQANIAIAIDPEVPAYRIDADFSGTPLHLALDQVCKASGLKYALKDGKIKVAGHGS